MPKFDPMTGEPLVEEATDETTTSQPAMHFDPMTGQPIYETQAQPPQKSHKMAILISIIVGAIVLIGILAVVLVTVLFSNPRAAVEKACVKTFSEGGYLYDVWKDAESFGDEYTVTSNVTMDMKSEYSEGSVSFDTQISVVGNDKQAAGTIEYNNAWITIPEIEYKVQLDDHELRLQIPTIDSHVFAYGYTGEKQGYLVKMIPAENIQIIDETLKTIYESSPSLDMKDTDLGEKLASWYRSLSFEKVQAKEFEVDGADRKCKGYAVSITQDEMQSLQQIYQEYVDVTMADQLKMLGMSAEEYTQELFADIQNMEEARVYFYLYDKELACIELQSDSSNCQVVFHGGDYRTQSIELLTDGDRVCSVTGTLDGDKETVTLDVQGDQMVLTYDRSSGAYSIDVENILEMNGTFSADKKERTLTVEKLALEGDYSDYTFSGDVTVTGGAVMDTMKGEIFDIGNADEEEYQELFNDLNQLLYGLLGY